MSISCAPSATATLYSNRLSYETLTQFETQTNNGTAVTTSFLQTSTRTAAIPTSTLYGSVCQTLVVASQSGRQTTVADSQATTSTSLQPTSTATIVSASTAASGGSVVLVTSYSTLSATSVFVILKTETPVATSSAVAASSGSSGSSSSHAGPIAGGIVAAVVLLALIGGLVWFMRKRSRRNRDTRALDDFFKDALNPGDSMGGVAALTAVGGSTRQSTMKRNPSMLIDLDQEKNLSNSNDGDNWAAMTRMSSLGHEDNDETVLPRSPQSRQSFNAGSRAVSMHSNGPDAALIAAMGWDGISEKQAMVEEPETMLDRSNSRRSASSPFQSPPHKSLMMPFDTNQVPRVRHLSNRSSDMVPPHSPILYSMTSSPELNPVDEFIPSIAPTSFGHPGYDRTMGHHMSMSSAIAPHPKARSFSASSQQMPERPKSSMGLMAITKPHDTLANQQTQQWSPHASPRNYPTTMNGRSQSRASMHSFHQNGSYNNSRSPSLYPQRAIPANRSRPSLWPQYSSSNGEYPPSRYSHLDVVNQGAEAETEAESVVPEALAVEGGRQRTLSGGLLLKTSTIAPEPTFSNTSTASKSNSLSIRNASPEQLTEDEETVAEKASKIPLDSTTPASTEAYHETVANTFFETSETLLSSEQNLEMNKEAKRKSSSWYPQAWISR
ncbi:hypothetical protein CBS101457_004491 [Exobasidium rhododendri]|nr:hypothetical protein CBS101457_004491 [Exobasidium rhododendri]